jgi:hypothetical protein
LKEYASSGEFLLKKGIGLYILAVGNGNKDYSPFKVQVELMVWREI